MAASCRAASVCDAKLCARIAIPSGLLCGEKYERLLAVILGDDAVRAPTAARKVGAGIRSQIRAWRMRAEELRSTADLFEVPSAQESLRTAARNYELMADNLENLLGHRPAAKGEKTGAPSDLE
jgi:hypothetical protein